MRSARDASALELTDAVPDGLCVDASGNLWLAAWGQGQVRCYSPAGELLDVIELPAPHTTSLAFVGPELDQLLITTARGELSRAEQDEFPLSGSLFLARRRLHRPAHPSLVRTPHHRRRRREAHAPRRPSAPNAPSSASTTTTYVDVSDVVDRLRRGLLRRGRPRALRAVVAERVARRQRGGRSAASGSARPIARPHQILCIGLNYSDHAAETGQAVPDEPILFTKSPNTLVGPYDDVRIPRGSTKTDWEVELGVVIGRRTSLPRLASRRPATRSPATCWSTTSASAPSRWSAAGSGRKGKSAETFNPAGPWLATPDEIDDVAGARHVARRQRRPPPDAARPRPWSSTPTSSCTTSASSWCSSPAT